MQRRRFVISLATLPLGVAANAWSRKRAPGMPADAALAKLMEGNRRYVRRQSKAPG